MKLIKVTQRKKLLTTLTLMLKKKKMTMKSATSTNKTPFQLWKTWAIVIRLSINQHCYKEKPAMIKLTGKVPRLKVTNFKINQMQK